mgnify:CR=1 FL=1
MVFLDKDVHIWITNDHSIKDANLLDSYRQLLNAEEMHRQQNFHFERHRHQYLVARALVRTVLSLYVENVSANDWIFEKNEYGKPFIVNKCPRTEKVIPIYFNLSHTENMLVLAISKNQKIGVDVENISRSCDELDIANSFFSSIEIEQLYTLPLDKQHDRFFDLWTLKEAYIKACGKGLSIPLHLFSYVFKSDSRVHLEFTPGYDDQAEGWRYWRIQPNDSYKIALALNDRHYAGDYRLQFKKIIPLISIEDITIPNTSYSNMGVKKGIF